MTAQFEESHCLVFYVNGIKVEERAVEPEWTLLYYLRNKMRLTGTKLGCGEGGCGACTVMISKYDRATSKIMHVAANACLTPVAAVHGLAVTTVEGISAAGTDGSADNRRRLHSVQERLAKGHGSQCGFCTPGFVMSMYTLLRNTSAPTMDQILEGFQGNLCRCTGYRPILESCRTFTNETNCCGQRSGSGGCCMDAPTDNQIAESSGERSVSTSLSADEYEAYDPSQEPIFPAELQLSDQLDRQFLILKGRRHTWYRPTDLGQLLELKRRFPEAKLIVGNTEVALEMKFKHCAYPVLVYPALVDQLQTIDSDPAGITVGGSVTLSCLQDRLDGEIRIRPAEQVRTYQSIRQMLTWFAGKQIRNVASVAGNIMTSSPISDLNPIFMAAGCTLLLQSSDSGARQVVMDGGFFTGYRKNVVRADEVLVSIRIPCTTKDEYLAAYKQSRRREDDIAIANCAFRVLFEPESSVIADIWMAFGGMAPTTVMATGTMRRIVSRRWQDADLLEDVCRFLLDDLPLPPSVPGGMAAYRQSLCLSFFFKFHQTVALQLKSRGIIDDPAGSVCRSAVGSVEHAPLKSAQLFELVPRDQEHCDPVGRPLPHAASAKHVTGQAVYCDDMPPLDGELYMSLLYSTRAHARIISVDPQEALAVAGVRAFFCSKDLAPERNQIGAVIHDEQVFASGTVTCYGQVIGCIVADDQAVAQRACRSVRVVYEDIEPAIITIEDAIERQSFYDEHFRRIVKGDVDAAMQQADHVIDGVIKMAGQEHFYLETNAVIAVPKGEDGEMEIVCSTQNPTEVQMLVAEVLHVPASRIVCKVKRMGGGFGGKETRSALLAVPAAFAASRLGRPVRCMLDRDEDMIMTGTRHPFMAKYRVGFTKQGTLMALDVQLYSNAGNSLDLSRSVMERACFHIDNSYRFANVRVMGRLCRTNLPSNTAFRGFGGPQGMLVCEDIISNVATFLHMEPADLRALNLYREGDQTHFNQTLSYCTLDRCWRQCRTQADYERRRMQVESFNKESRWKKRGIAMVPTKFGISFTALFLNQAGALVHIYKDGSVLVTHGGTEMGQGLHTKMIQVACRVLRVPAEKVFISETSTDKVPNTSPTAASVGSDINGMAVLNACQILWDRLEPVRKANPSASWEDWISQAYFQRISLSSTGFYKTPNIGYDFSTNSGDAFSYFTFGAACSEVEVDCLTGDHRVLRSDIVMDLGESLNPAIDIGQIEGGFVQGLGLFTLEEPLFSPAGYIITRGPSNYKIPSADDIPHEFNVSLLRGCPNPRAVYSSKAVGEPPLFLASSIFFAIKNAVESARRDAGFDGRFRFDSPATAERIRMACEDHLTLKVHRPQEGSFKPWAVSV